MKFKPELTSFEDRATPSSAMDALVEAFTAAGYLPPPPANDLPYGIDGFENNPIPTVDLPYWEN